MKLYTLVQHEQRAFAMGKRLHAYMEALITGRVDELIPCVVLDGHTAACAFVQGVDMIDVTPRQRADMKQLSFALAGTNKTLVRW